MVIFKIMNAVICNINSGIIKRKKRENLTAHQCIYICANQRFILHYLVSSQNVIKVIGDLTGVCKITILVHDPTPSPDHLVWL